MKREIKFRAWTGEKMTQQFHITGMGIAWQSTDNALEDYTESVDWPIMQFTGLKDKNGVEIYEEDIVAVSNRKRKAKTEPTYTTTIVYRWHGFTLDKNDTYFTDSACINKQCEVIGNIYQNPELLNK